MRPARNKLKPFLTIKSKSIPRLPLPYTKPSVPLYKSHERLSGVGKDKRGKVMRLISLHQVQKGEIASARDSDKLKVAKAIKAESKFAYSKVIRNNVPNESLMNNKENSQLSSTGLSRMSNSTLPLSRNFNTNKTSTTITTDMNLKRDELNKITKRQVSGASTRCNSRMNMLNKFIVNCKVFEAESNTCESMLNTKRNRMESTMKYKEEENKVFIDIDGPMKGMKAKKSHECFTEVFNKKLAWTLARISRNKNILKTIEHETYRKNNEVTLHKLVMTKSKKDSEKESKRSTLFRNYANRVIQRLSYF
jgi:hypothetical protein